MAKRLPDNQLKQLVQAIEHHLGLNYPDDRLDDLVRAVSQASRSLGYSDPGDCLEWLLSSPQAADRMESLADFLTVGETYFFRDGKLFSAFEREFIPRLIRRRSGTRKRLRIWSAGCASGEEPYSVAMVVKRAIPDLDDWDVTILATDINQRFLRKGMTGVYGQWSFRDAPSEITKAHFKRGPSGYEVIPEIRKMVRFDRLNLARGSFPDPFTDTHEMDVIFCRNVLMYFSQKWQEEVIERFSRSLSNGGWLVVSPAEASLVDHKHFEQVSIPGVVLFRKRSRPASVVPSHPRKQFESGSRPILVERSEWVDIPREILSATISVETPTSLTQVHQAPAQVSEAQEDPCKVGLELFSQGKYAEAAIELQQALEQSQVRNIDSAEAMSTLARAYANLGMLEQALAWCEKTFEADKLNPEYHFLEATILEEMGDLERAQTSLNRALFLDPDLVVARFAMGNLARRQGKLSISNRHYRIALEVLANYDEEETLPGSDNLTAGRLTEAIQATMVREIAYEQS